MRLVFSGLILVVIIYFLSRSLIIKTLVCRVNGEICSQEILDIFRPLIGGNISSVRKNNLEWSLKQIFPLENLKYNFSYPNTLEITMTGNDDGYEVTGYQVSALPNLTFDSLSTESGSITSPSREIKSFINGLVGNPGKIWMSGDITPDSSSPSANIHHVYTHLPSSGTVSAIFKIITLVSRYIENSVIYIWEDRVFLSHDYLPDIIIYVDADLADVESSLQSLDFLVTIKKDAKVLNLSFKHPIIK